ncbi:T9SS type A sorting domain-containing protein [Bacteroidales bacterium OttesenSCG-928-L03]|nr:T9SS type A sorting domain-containing protein [Bacteroidales bacterium OttesenSCG-928-L03]
MKKVLLLTFVLLQSLFVFAQEKVLAFPTAEGFGAYALGGRGGKVVEVTTLEDDANGTTVGSLRWALKQHSGEPITVVFRVSGIINLKAELRCKRNNYTIAGQTAPGDGICIAGDEVNLGGSTHFILRHLRFRIGALENPSGRGSIGIENASDFILDHCTIGWSGEENMTMYDNHRTTVQWCIVHEGLYNANHPKGNRGYGAQWGGQTASYHHNLLAHNYSRSPRFNGARSNDRNVLYDFVNNVIYNWGKQNAIHGGDIDENGQTHRANVVNNYYKPGPARPASSSSYFVEASYGGVAGRTAVWWLSGNVMQGNASYTQNNFLGLNKTRYPSQYQSLMEATEPFEISHPVKTETADAAYLNVLAGAGAFPRDTVDRRIVQETRTGTASGYGSFDSGRVKGMIDDPAIVGGYPEYKTYDVPQDTDQDGMPDAWELANGLNPNDATDRNKVTKSGYTALEVYLNGLVGEVIPLEFAPSSFNEISLPKVSVSVIGDSLTILSDTDVVGATIYSMLGAPQLVARGQSLREVDINNLGQGIYIAKINTGDKKEVVCKFKK